MDYTKQLRQAETELAKRDEKLRELINTHGPCDLTPHTDYFRALLRSIIGQQLSVKAASTIYARFLALFQGHIPSPEVLLACDVTQLRSVGLSNAKTAYVRDLAQHIVDGRLDLDHVATLPNEALISELVDVKGIGVWSAHMFLIFCLGRLDVLPVGDLGIVVAISKVYDLPARPTPAEIIELAERKAWAPYQSVASWYLWRSLDNAVK